MTYHNYLVITNSSRLLGCSGRWILVDQNMFNRLRTGYSFHVCYDHFRSLTQFVGRQQKRLQGLL